MGKYKINILDESRIFDEREKGRIHTPYQFETVFFESVKKGSRTDVKAYINLMLNDGITVGRMSSDKLREIQYWAVSSLTLLTRSAIQGGLDETTAYNFSDNSIYQIDTMTKTDEIVEYVMQRCIALTDMIAENRENSVYPQSIRKCLHYIRTQRLAYSKEMLKEDYSVSDIAYYLGFCSESYFIKCFKEEFGKTPRKYRN